MKKVIERMNAGIEEQAALRGKSGFAAPKGGDKGDKGRKNWLFRKASGTGKDEKPTPTNGDGEEVEGMRVDFYLVVFLKFIASIVPTIEVDSTTSW